MLSHFGLMRPNHTAYACRCELCGPAFRPGIDLLVPDMMERGQKSSTPLSARGAFPPSPARRTLLFFGGARHGYLREHLFDSIASDPAFGSAGVRRESVVRPHAQGFSARADEGDLPTEVHLSEDLVDLKARDSCARFLREVPARDSCAPARAVRRA